MSKLFKSCSLAILLALLTGCGGSNSPVPGEWVGGAEFGRLEFTIGPESETASAVSFDLQNFTCGSVSISGQIGVFNSGGWDIDDGDLAITANLGSSGDHLEVNIAFDGSGEFGVGEWTRTVNGSTCSGTFNAVPLD
jgi:hypothetical protein